MLADFGYLLTQHAFDWPATWQLAAKEGWQSHLALCLAGARRWSGIDAPWPTLPLSVPEELVESLPLLLAKPMAAREADIATAKAASGARSLGDKIARALAQRERHADLASYLGWIGRETGGVLRSTLGARDRMTAISLLDGFLET